MSVSVGISSAFSDKGTRIGIVHRAVKYNTLPMIPPIGAARLEPRCEPAIPKVKGLLCIVVIILFS